MVLENETNKTTSNEKADITVNVGGYKLNVRAAGIIIHNNKILVHKKTDSDYCALIGGRVQSGEDSETTIRREILEELGKQIEIKNHFSTVENFFKANGENYHEIMFIYNVEFTNEKDKLIEETLDNIEGKKDLKFEWIPLDETDKYNLRPEVLNKILKDGENASHVINKD